MIDPIRVDNRETLWVGRSFAAFSSGSVAAFIRRGMLGLALLCLVPGLVACIEDNPSYTGATDGGGPGADLARARDLAMPAAVNTSGTCSGGGRACTPAACPGFVPERACPPGSSCDSGYCQVPAGQPGSTLGLKCGSESQCYISQQTYNNSCQPFIVAGRSEWHCGTKVGDGASGQPCQSGADCRSGYCIPGVGTCFRLCAGSDADCPVRNGVHLVCRPAQLTVENVSVNSTSCVLP